MTSDNLDVDTSLNLFFIYYFSRLTACFNHIDGFKWNLKLTSKWKQNRIVIVDFSAVLYGFLAFFQTIKEQNRSWLAPQCSLVRDKCLHLNFFFLWKMMHSKWYTSFTVWCYFKMIKKPTEMNESKTRTKNRQRQLCIFALNSLWNMYQVIYLFASHFSHIVCHL